MDIKLILPRGDMKLALKLLVIVITVCTALAHAAVGEVAEVAEPTVSTGWVVFFLVTFVAICCWIGYAIWRADKKK